MDPYSRLDRLEQELAHLRAFRGQQESAVYPQLMAPQFQVGEVLAAHRTLVDSMLREEATHQELMQSHHELMQLHAAVTGGRRPKKRPALGVLRLDCSHPSVPGAGDAKYPASSGYNVHYCAVPGLTPEMLKAGNLAEAVERRFAESIKHLEQQGVCAIAGECRLMVAFRALARKIAAKPVLMSPMIQCPVVAAALEPKDQILILTASDQSLGPQQQVLIESCGFTVDEHRFVVRGCQEVPGFGAVAKGEQAPLEVVQPGVVKLAMDALKQHPSVKGILLECTELPPYADALRAATELPVWDAVTGADFYASALRDNPRVSFADWMEDWDDEQEEACTFSSSFAESVWAESVSKPLGKKAQAKAKAKALVKKIERNLVKKQSPVLGVVRLDCDRLRARGDGDCLGSHSYEILFRQVPGLTFEMAQSGKMSQAVQKDFAHAIRWLELQGACAITGDCGFMMAFQPYAREVASVPVFMSPMVQCPMVRCALDGCDKILVLTAAGNTLRPQKECLLQECGFDIGDHRFVIQGCQDVPGFEALASGNKADVEHVAPGLLRTVMDLLAAQPAIRAILLECTELAPCAGALRDCTGLAVFDAITCTDLFISAGVDSPRFGFNQWQNDWEGTVREYKLGRNLTPSQKARLRMGMA